MEYFRYFSVMQTQFIGFNDLCQKYQTASTIVCLLVSTCLIIKFYKKWKYSQKLFNKKEEICNKAILITGCDTGFGYAMALKLSIKLGYPVIATCLKQSSVNNFLSNSLFTKNNSTSVVLDVTNDANIEKVKQFTIKYLNKNKKNLWGIVNNAGINIPGQFELVPKEYDIFQRTILFLAPLNIIRTFLPLLPGRKNYNKLQKQNKYCSGGRIVNMSSLTARVIMDTRYGASKAALSYFSHALRMELVNKFGIWVCPIEPDAYATSIQQANNVWAQKVEKHLTENNKRHLMDIYDFNVEEYAKKQQNYGQTRRNQNIDDVIDDVVHALTAKYPKRVYTPGKSVLAALGIYGPWWITEPMTTRYKKANGK